MTALHDVTQTAAIFCRSNARDPADMLNYNH